MSRRAAIRVRPLTRPASTLAIAGAVSLFAPATRAATQFFAPIPTGSIGGSLTPIATGLTSPVAITPATDGSGRMFITDQTGKVDVLQNGSVLSTPFLDVSSRLPPAAFGGAYDERGLLGFALDPNFNGTPGTPGYHTVYTYNSEPAGTGTAQFSVPVTGTYDHQGVLSAWTVSSANPNQVDPNSRREILRWSSPQFNHDGGTIRFGPDGMLYFGLGDGGNANDVGDGHTAGIGNAQDPTNIQGKILRIDVHGTNGVNGQYGVPADNPFVNNASPAAKIIYAYGLRNPYSFSFDKGGTHDLIAGDVGQNNVEEVDKIVKGADYGWHYKEGTLAFDPNTGNASTNLTGVPTTVTDPNGNTIPLTDPLAEYDHTQGQAIIGGFVYRGTAIPALQGKYVFGELAGTTTAATPQGRLLYADLTTGQISEFATPLPHGFLIKGMGEDLNGELYLAGSNVLGPTGTTGEIIAIGAPEPASLGLLAVGGLFVLRRRRTRALAV